MSERKQSSAIEMQIILYEAFAEVAAKLAGERESSYELQMLESSGALIERKPLTVKSKSSLWKLTSSPQN